MVIAEIVTLLFYAVSMAFLPEYFGTSSPFSYELVPKQSFRSFIRHLTTVRLESCCHRRS